uniref:Pre-mRNA-splicing factor cwf25 n=1 Tax=Noccaea caerulescens TaxID=107243 RepID=A0A1J3CP46_NOCCA
MGMKFLNKKGWHTGSLRNIETVWKAEQKQEAEQKKLEELRLQIVQERERSEFRALQEQAGLVPRQERLEFLYESGLAVGKGSASSSGHGVSFQKEELPLAQAEAGTNEKPDQSVPGALFEEKAQSANDSWRKLHSDPLLLIRQREQEALARIKNNPVKMALIRKSVEEKGKDKDGDSKEHKKKRKSGKHRKQSSSRRHSDSEEDSGEEDNGRKANRHKTSGTHDKHYERTRSDLEDESNRRDSRGQRYERRRSELDDESKRRESHDKYYERRKSDLEDGSKSHDKHYERRRSDIDESRSHDKHYERRRSDLEDDSKRRESRREPRASETYRNRSPTSRLERENLKSYGQEDRKRKNEDVENEKHPSRENEFQNRRRKGGSKLSEEERAARFKQMQMDAEVHEEQRWRRLKKADEKDAVEADKNKVSTGKSFLDDASKNVYGVEKGGSSTIEESVRRRSYYSQRGAEAEGNAFRR